MILTVNRKLVNNSGTMLKKGFLIPFVFSSPYLLPFVVLAMLLASGFQCFAQQVADTSKTLSGAEIERIIKAFTTKEAEFHRALNEYAFKRDALLQTVGMGGQITGEYHRVSNFSFDDQGIRYEKITLFPMPSFPGVTPEDLEDLGGVNPYALEPSKTDQYNFRYVGKERIDELDLYVFDVTPKVVPNP